MSKIAIIGTAGRDLTKPMTRELWDWMVKDATGRVTEDDHLVSGGAAWADHLAVYLFIHGKVSALTLHLPAPFKDGLFEGPKNSSGPVANFYHLKFLMVRGEDSFKEIELALQMGATVTYEPPRAGFRGFMDRNSKVARAERLLAYTFSNLSVPADGGTKDTWTKCRGQRTHISLPIFKDRQ